MIKIPIPRFQYINDVKRFDERKIFSKVQISANFSSSFIALLSGSVVICTLGLLLNATPIVIGGMIISPLMWPLMKISLGVSFEKIDYIKQGVLLVVFAIILSLISSSVITILSPIKLINTEILARTSPTLIDLIIALVAGGIAALAVTQPKISESLAGVAIATSLLPPLCVSGIGLALFNLPVFLGGFLLFFANIVSIIFISTLTFILIGVKNHGNAELRTKGVIFIGIILLFTSIPLSLLLKSYSFRAVAYHKVHNALQKSFREISTSIIIDSVKTDISPKDSNNILVEVQAWLPEDLTIDYQQQQEIVRSLERALNRKVDLNLRLQRAISIVSKKDRLNENLKKQLKNLFIEEIQKINSSFSIDLLEIEIDEESQRFVMKSVLRSDPSVPMTFKQRENLENILSTKTGKKISLDIEIISRIQLQSSPEIENQQIKQEIQTLVQEEISEVDISYISLKTEKHISAIDENKTIETIIIDLGLKAPKDYQIPDKTFKYIKSQLASKFARNFAFVVKIIEEKSYFF